MDTKEFLKTIEGFERLEDSELERFARLGKLKSVRAGEPVDVQGQPADRFYILVSGRLAVILTLDFGVAQQTYQIMTLGPGQMFAWSGLVGNQHYTAGSRALTDCTFLEFEVAELERLFDQDPRLGYVLMRLVARTIASRLRHIQLQLAQQFALRESTE
ncbi:MAG: cyclic nucleotide-binding domain-containing protein [candidate division WOR-3 bacterium]|uniref:Cyclic nucleotide-binding domain-containing protein n=1 Tax=candidate division WOR-3 bacterium TaxID=2052148 RepID=A0A7C1SE28_UNCW3|nr:cyclic nucleotide-binding domain-containing protein [candidate division WOR-3 bacterium]